jgi:MFS family permease
MALLVAGAIFIEILDATIIAPAVPRIADSFGVAAVDVNVAISAYLVTVAVLIPATGWMADRFGVRRHGRCGDQPAHCERFLAALV